MCGIAGVVNFSREHQVDAAVVRRMCAAMVHRGPDDEGVYAQDRVGIGMRRLSIIDVVHGHQPLSNEDGSLWIVFNGEIYNHAALREQLIARGHRFSTHCDTEAIVHLYEEYGRDCVQHLRGMFAFAIWDTKKRRLFIARDRLGIKPLYYRHTPESFLFGSEIKVVLAHPGVRAEFHRASLPEYLAFGYLSGEQTFYEGIRKLMPGHTLELEDNGELHIEPYWDLHVVKDHDGHSESYYVEKYRELLEQAVSSHLMSDVPLGVFLSGGIDSSAVAALMTKIRKAPVETFSVGYSENTYSELPFARTVAQHINSIHHEVLVSRHDFFDSLAKLIWQEDEPVVWPSSVALYFVARLASQHVKVVLTGEGADETLGGYSRYAFTLKNAAMDRVYRRLTPSMLRRGIRNSLANSPLISAALRRKLSHTFVALEGEDWASFYFDNFFSAFNSKRQEDLLASEFKQELTEGAAYRNVLKYWEQSSGDMLHRLLYTDIKTYLVELLMKQDQMSMAASIESRVPFLDHVLLEFATNIPRRFQLHGLTGKHILKKAVKDLLPHSILYRPKLGFPTPWSRWLAGAQIDSIESMLLESRSMDRGFFKSDAIEHLFNEHRAKSHDHYDRIWRLLNLELWHRVCLEGESHEFAMQERSVNLATPLA
ncbi:MAG: asparagine synthase (glutamine-hydrolyzing) [Acidobacteriaceae bacterium]|jgi:asparagine synthase (glutamine-hydrolysing)|nr:asparagine synthase (glutamine-hydrolyzing) [Acidobacteriaceae bacterium]